MSFSTEARNVSKPSCSLANYTVYKRKQIKPDKGQHTSQLWIVFLFVRYVFDAFRLVMITWVVTAQIPPIMAIVVRNIAV